MTRTQEVVWAQNVGKDSLELVGGKGANLGEMLQIGLPVPPAFIVTAEAYRVFLEETGAGEKVFALLREVNVDDHKSLSEASEKARRIIMDAGMPKGLKTEIVSAYQAMSKSEKDGAPPLVAVRSSATAEDLPEASFAGQQETFLNVLGEDALLLHTRKCWASLYTPRAIFYRAKNDFDHEKVAIAVVVQRMVDAVKAGVMFTKHPSTGEDKTIIECAWGLGEGVVSGSVSPDHFVLDSRGNVEQVTVSDKSTMHVRSKKGDSTVIEPVPKDQRQARTLDDAELKQLQGLARALEKHYGTPQDVEWALDAEGNLYVLQTRPVTTIRKDSGRTAKPEAGKQKGAVKVILTGLGASPGIRSGKIAHIENIEELDKCKDGDILLTSMTTPDMVPAMRRAAAIITDEGGMTCHAAIVSRELGVPCIVGTKKATKTLRDGLVVTVDGDRGTIVEGDHAPKESTSESAGPAVRTVAEKPLTATQVKVNISMPEAIGRAMQTDPDGVGLLRVEHIVLGLGKHPLTFIHGGKEDEYVDYLVESIKTVADPMYPRPVWVRTLDAPTDEFRAMEGGGEEPHEPNPMLGWRGIRRSLDQQELLRAEFKAIKKLHEMGFTNVGVMLPLVQHPLEVRKAKQILRDVGLEPHTQVEFGIMIEIPAAALIIDDILAEGLDFVSFGTNDLTQYTLAVDRNNEHVASLYTEFHPAIGKLIEMVIKSARAHGVQTSICGQAGSNPKFVEKLISWGITSVSANIDALPRVREMIARTERKMILDSARK